VTYASWDSRNKVTATTDARGDLNSQYVTKYAYDQYGNTIAVAQPSVTTSVGTFRPIATYSYDSNSNLQSYCDPAKNGSSVAFPVNPGPDNLCSTTPGGGSTVYVYAPTSAEPLGELTDAYSACYPAACLSPGSHEHYSYDPNGLPVSVASDPITNQANGASITPTQLFVYDSLGNLQCFSKLQDSGGTHWWRLVYDSMNRVVGTADADDATLSSAGCSNNPGIAGSNITSTTQYNTDGSVLWTQSPSERAMGVRSSFTYDADGNVLTSVSHHGCTQAQPSNACLDGVTQKFYDGEDRLVEVINPTNDDSSILNGGGNYNILPWLTRYIYDLSLNGQVSMDYGTAFSAHGNLYKTQRYLPGTLIELGIGGYGGGVVSAQAKAKASGQAKARSAAPASFRGPLLAHPRGAVVIPRGTHPLRISRSQNSTQVGMRSAMAGPVSPFPEKWYDVGGKAFDALDRATADYRYLPGQNVIAATTMSYDQNQGVSQPGLLLAKTSPIGDVTSYTYDALGRSTAIAFALASGSSTAFTPGRQYVFDPDGRVVSVGNTQFGTWSYTYDADSRLAKVVEPSGGTGLPGLPFDSGTISSHTTFSYGYYSNGAHASVSAATPTGTYSESTSYRADGLVADTLYSATGGHISRTYTPAGRELQRTDPIGAETRTYDAQGRTATYSAPEFTISGFKYDGEGNLSLYQQATPSSQSRTYGNDANGQLVGANGVTAFLDGAPFGIMNDFCNLDNSSCISTYQVVDARNLLKVGYDFSSTGSPSGQVSSFVFDADGRLQQTVGANFWVDTRTNTISGGVNEDEAFQYDAEDHTTFNQTYVPNTYNPSQLDSTDQAYYDWGPTGHPVTVGSFPTTAGWVPRTIHWDGSFAMLESSPSGVDDIKLGLDGEILPTSSSGSLTTFYWDRDEKSNNFAMHSALGSTYAGGGFYGGDNAGGPTFSYQSVDGITDNLSTIQGVRSYSPGTLQWTTPDAAGGSIGDPMSQSKYMWNDNNPIAYSDPTGYSPSIEEPGYGSTDVAVIQIQQPTARKERDWSAARDYLGRDPAVKAMIEGMEQSPTIYRLFMDYGSKDDNVPALSTDIHWDPSAGSALLYGAGTQSPALQLLHELGHASEDPKVRFYLSTLNLTSMKNGLQYYGDVEEWRVIAGIETPAAKFLGEPARNCWCGRPVTVPSVTYHTP
jgi:RHS repeat-associated protein